MIFRSFVWSPIIYRLSSDHIAKGVGFIYKFVCCYMQSMEDHVIIFIKIWHLEMVL